MDAETTRDPVLDGRMLRRAEHLPRTPSTNGKHGGKHTENDSSGADPLEGQRIRRQTTFGGSLMRKLQEVKADATRFLSRSRSLQGRSPTPNALHVTKEEADGIKKKKGHARSLSEVSQVRSSGSGLAAINTSGLKSHQRVLSEVVEQDPAGVVLSPVAQDSAGPPPPTEVRPDGDVVVPQLLQSGTPMTKVSAKKHKKAVFRLDADLGQIVWESKQHKIIPIENIKEIRTGKDARYYREQFQLSQDYEDRWLTLIYMMDNNYKTLHLIAATKDVFKMWETTLRQLHAIRQELMTGLGNLEMRQTLWEKQYWKNADEERDQKLTFEEITKLCKRLNINSSPEDLYNLFKQADPQDRGYLEFEDFRKFVKLLKGRPEIRRIYNKLRDRNGGVFNYAVFEVFMREKQQSTLSQDELKTLYNKYTKPKDSMEAPDMSVDAFTSFLLSPDNAVFSDQHAKVSHDMTRPLSEYFISSSHNTYLVGHQLVGDSTIEGYIRALLHSCRSVEVDIYDGDTEPMITHGKTFTSKVSLREVCEAIKKYGFVASPYPIIISAEVHCSVPQQDMIAEIMVSVFGDSLVREPPEGPLKIEALPSPEELKGKIMLKTKNLLLAASTEQSDSDASSTDPSASSASASETEFTVPAIREVPPERKKHARRQSDVAKLGQAVLQRVRSIGKAPASPHSPSTSQSRLPRNATSTVSVLSPAITIPVPISARRPSESTTLDSPRPKPKMSLALVALLVYTVGVKCRGLNKKEVYAPEHMFSLSETTLKRMMKEVGTVDLIKHTRTHLVRTYPKGTRVRSSNYEPHRFWATGAQLVALNWQTFVTHTTHDVTLDLGYMINHAMFQRNGRSGYVLKPLALRAPNKDLLTKQTTHVFQATIISAQQLPRPKNALGHEIMSGNAVDPYVEVSLYVPDWPSVPPPGAPTGISRSSSIRKDRQHRASWTGAREAPPLNGSTSVLGGAESGGLVPPGTPAPTVIPGKTISFKTGAVKNNGFNPVWEEKLSIPFNCVGDMLDLVFVRFVVRRQEDKEGDEPLAIYCASLGSLGRGYRHLPLHDSQLSQYLFSTLFVRINL
ncbi:hypothetical protein MD484_g2466, partial [Candolleomyces efflorescens]